MSLREYHLAESEYHLDGRLEKLVETLRAIRARARTAGRSLDAGARSRSLLLPLIPPATAGSRLAQHAYRCSGAPTSGWLQSACVSLTIA